MDARFLSTPRPPPLHTHPASPPHTHVCPPPQAYVDARFLSVPRVAGEEKPAGGKKKKEKAKPDAGVWEFVKKSQKVGEGIRGWVGQGWREPEGG